MKRVTVLYSKLYNNPVVVTTGDVRTAIESLYDSKRHHITRSSDTMWSVTTTNRISMVVDLIEVHTVPMLDTKDRK